MPYIEDENARRIYDRLSKLVASALKDKKEGMSGGELNYFICKLLLHLDAESYEDHVTNMAHIKQALYEYKRKVLAKYEDEKEEENGTIWF